MCTYTETNEQRPLSSYHLPPGLSPLEPRFLLRPRFVNRVESMGGLSTSLPHCKSQK